MRVPETPSAACADQSPRACCRLPQPARCQSQLAARAFRFPPRGRVEPFRVFPLQPRRVRGCEHAVSRGVVSEPCVGAPGTHANSAAAETDDV